MITANSRRAHRVDTRTSLRALGARWGRTAACITPTRRGLVHHIVRRARMAWLRWEISSAEDWIHTCAREGIHGTESLRHLERHVQALRVKLALVEAS